MLMWEKRHFPMASFFHGVISPQFMQLTKYTFLHSNWPAMSCPFNLSNFRVTVSRNRTPDPCSGVQSLTIHASLPNYLHSSNNTSNITQVNPDIICDIVIIFTGDLSSKLLTRSQAEVLESSHLACPFGRSLHFLLAYCWGVRAHSMLAVKPWGVIGQTYFPRDSYVTWVLQASGNREILELVYFNYMLN